MAVDFELAFESLRHDVENSHMASPVLLVERGDESSLVVMSGDPVECLRAFVAAGHRCDRVTMCCETWLTSKDDTGADAGLDEAAMAIAVGSGHIDAIRWHKFIRRDDGVVWLEQCDDMAASGQFPLIVTMLATMTRP